MCTELLSCVRCVGNIVYNFMCVTSLGLHHSPVRQVFRMRCQVQRGDIAFPQSHGLHMAKQ